jgi:uncharacterized protein YbaR (Trm112 family)|tara:strand:+ start:115 stop:276 length:162 start_codon:yes stop_codon:yes gene_type:complete
MEKFDQSILEFLICPKTGKSLIYDKNKNILHTKDLKNKYKIKDGIPILKITND